MQKFRTFTLLSALSIAVGAAPLAGCEKKAEPVSPAPVKSAGTAAPKLDDHDHKEGDGHDHDNPAAGMDAETHDDHGHGHAGASIALGEQTIGPFTVAASRDEGQIVAGKDASINANVTPAAGSAAKATAVRFWIGTQDGKGSVKAKAEMENPADPTKWHVHAEIPDPMPAGSTLWVEIEDDKGEKTVVGFDLKS